MSKEVKLALKMAIGSHGLWKDRLRSVIDNKTSEFDTDFVRSCQNFKFGKWLESERSMLVKYKQYKKVYRLFSDVHLRIADVMELALAGKKKEAEVKLERDFTEASNAFIKEMKNWSDSLG